MLLEIAIADIALIERLRLGLGAGLNVLTGETGAGKSIVVDALSLALGGRADRELIRTGADKARVEVLFDVADNREALKLLGEMGLEAEDGLLPLTRELTANGRSVCRACGSVVPLNQFKQLTGLLVDMHGQHEHQQLADPARHLNYLDGYGDAEHAALIAQVRARYADFAALRREAEALSIDASERERRRDMLAFQLGEIDAVKPKRGEEEKLKQKSELMKNAEQVAQGVQRAYELTYKGGRSASAQEALKRAAEAMEPIAHLDERFERLKARLFDLYYAAEDVGYELQDLNDGLEFDPAEADRVGARLSELKRIARKYGPELDDVLAFREDAALKLHELDGGDERLREIEKALSARERALTEACAQLSDSRRRLARAFTERVMAELTDLGMERARFEVQIAPRALCSADGRDQVQFMLSANPGEPVKPLSSVASGGELSRIMLAMKAAAADSAGVDAMVFDEIDTGVSGRMAQVVGEKMAAIARKRQVICVTHLPQIAALADRQYLALKVTDDERTTSSVELLDRAGRIEELSRLVGGAGDPASGRAHAEHLLTAAQALIESLSER
ncbi:DNA repair protein RecN [Bacillota bacterium Meth-B3]